MSKPDPIEVAQQFLALSGADFRLFWQIVARELNHEESDLDAVWFFNGQKMTAMDVSVIRSLHTYVASGQEAAAKKDASQ